MEELFEDLWPIAIVIVACVFDPLNAVAGAAVGLAVRRLRPFDIGWPRFLAGTVAASVVAQLLYGAYSGALPTPAAVGMGFAICLTTALVLGRKLVSVTEL